jgi:hypothetical protein
MAFKVSVKWGKELYKDVDVDTTQSPLVFKSQLYTLTSVPPERQKITIKGSLLKDDDWGKAVPKDGATVLLLGTADAISVEAPKNAPVFVEDLPEDEQDTMGTKAYGSGLTNLGNTCYMNSTVQCLYSVDALQSAIAKFAPAAAADPASKLVVATKELFADLKKGGSAFPPFKFLMSLRERFPQFAQTGQKGEYMQQDAEECFSQVMYTLREKLKVGGGRLAGLVLGGGIVSRGSSGGSSSNGVQGSSPSRAAGRSNDPNQPTDRLAPPPQEEDGGSVVDKLFGLGTVTKLTAEEGGEEINEKGLAYTLKCNIANDTNYLHQVGGGLGSSRQQNTQPQLSQTRSLCAPAGHPPHPPPFTPHPSPPHTPAGHRPRPRRGPREEQRGRRPQRPLQGQQRAGDAAAVPHGADDAVLLQGGRAAEGQDPAQGGGGGRGGMWGREAAWFCREERSPAALHAPSPNPLSALSTRHHCQVTFPAELDVFDFCSAELKKELEAPRQALKDYEDEQVGGAGDAGWLLVASVLVAAGWGVGCRLHLVFVFLPQPLTLTSHAAPHTPLNPPKVEIRKKAPKQQKLNSGATAAAGDAEMADAAAAAGPSSSAAPGPLTGRYQLSAVLTHKGRSADSGHYVAWVKQADGTWALFDDDQIIPKTEEDVLALSGGGDWHMAYLIMYTAVRAPAAGAKAAAAVEEVAEAAAPMDT